jgi:hypothetical protein
MNKLAERRILLLVITSALVLIYLIWWVSYAQTHQNPRYRQLAPGAAVSVKGLTVRLEQLIIADQLAAEDKTEPPAVPVSGAVWVVAQYQVSQRDFKQTCCNFVLVGPTVLRGATPTRLSAARSGRSTAPRPRRTSSSRSSKCHPASPGS